MPAVARPPHVEAARRFREVLAAYEAQKDLILIGAYKKGTDPRTDLAIAKADAMNAFLRQGTTEKAPPQTPSPNCKRCSNDPPSNCTDKADGLARRRLILRLRRKLVRVSFTPTRRRDNYMISGEEKWR